MNRIYFCLIMLTINLCLFSLWTNEQKVTSSDVDIDDCFGYSVSVSGDYAVVGSYRDDDAGSASGSAYIYELNNNIWTETAKLTASDADSTDWYGTAVNIHNDTVLIGVDNNDTNDSFAGCAYFYTRNDTIWEEQQVFPIEPQIYSRFGTSVCIGDSVAVIGAPFLEENGAAYVFTKQDTLWVQEAILTASDGSSGDYFGNSVSIHGEYVAVGAPFDDDAGISSGSGYVFHKVNDVWIEEAKITAIDGEEGDQLGYTLSLFEDKILVSAFKDDGNFQDTGSVYVFGMYQDEWTFQQKLIASDSPLDARFGNSVSLCADTALIGSYWDHEMGAYSGSAYIFKFDSGEWLQEQKLFASDGTHEAVFGFSVSLSEENALIGSYRMDDTGAAYFYSDEDVYAEDDEIVPANISLSNSPNPFNPSTKISFSLTTEHTESTEIFIYNIKGQLVEEIGVRNWESGIHSVVWNAEKYASGVYFYKLNVKNSPAKKMMLIK